MLNLMKLELKRNNFQTFISAAIFSCLGIIAFNYFVAYVAQVENEVQFQNYTNIIRFVFIMSLLVFSILSATMYSRFVIAEYGGTKLALLFSYPVNRKRIFVSKLLLIILFISMSMTVTMAGTFTLFCITEHIAPIVQDTFSIHLCATAIKIMSLCVVGTVAIGVISMRIGFIKKSSQTTIITAFFLSGMMGNLIIGFAENILFEIGFIIVLVVLSLLIILELSRKISKMEDDHEEV